MGVGLREQYGAFNTALQSLYDDDTLLLAEREKNFEFDDAVFDEAVRRVYDLQGFDAEKLADPAIRELITETARILGAAIDKGLVGTLGSSVRGSESKSATQAPPAPTDSVEHEVPETLRYALENNAFTFSGFKTFHCMREVGLSLTNDEGHIKPFAEFLTDVKKINQKYNHHYLEAEYNHAVAASQMASRWHDFEQDGDDYNLQYRTADDDRVREDHAVLHNTTLPPSDPFWDKYFPPNGWNCRCTVVQVRKEKYPVSDPALAMLRGDNCTDGEKKKIFRYNPGKSLELFPPKHPYYKVPAKVRQAVEVAEVLREDVYKHGKGVIRISEHVDRNDSDYGKLLEIAEYFANDGAEVRLTPKMARPPKFKYDAVYKSLIGTKYEGKCPDLCIDGKWYEHEGFTSDNPKKAFKNMLNHGLKQSDRLIIEEPDLTDAYMKRVIKQRVFDKQSISEVWVKDGEKVRPLYKKSEE